MPEQPQPPESSRVGRASLADTPLAGFLSFLADLPDGDTVALSICQGMLAGFAPRVTTIHLARPEDQALTLEGQHGFGHDMARLYGTLHMDLDLPATDAYRLNSPVLVPLAGATGHYPLFATYARALAEAEAEVEVEVEVDGQLAFFPLRCRSLPIGVLGLEFGHAVDNWHLRSEVEPILAALVLWAVSTLRPVDVTIRGGLSHRQASRLEVTDRQQRIIDLVEEGLTNAQIGRRLGFSAGTVKAELGLLSARFGASDRMDLVRKTGHAPP